ncbi:hypothetical protein TNCV_4152211 [Trichonephila clavipes]|nr:hypothetical protein TNCV_4152211 [Trichonephila clavipes]
METWEMLSKVHGESILARSKIHELHRRFEEGRESIEYNERVGRTSTSRKMLRWCLNVFKKIAVKHLSKLLRLHTSGRCRLRESIPRKSLSSGRVTIGIFCMATH